MSNRILKINNLVKQELGELLLKEVDFPRGVIVSISRVETSRDLAQSRVFLSVFPHESRTLVLKTLAKTTFNLERLLNKKLKTRKVPKINFEIDRAEEYAERVEELLGRI